MHHQIWISRGRGLEPSERFRDLEKAIASAIVLSLSSRVAIRLPDGTWYRWPNTGTVMLKARVAC